MTEDQIEALVTSVAKLLDFAANQANRQGNTPEYQEMYEQLAYLKIIFEIDT